MTGGDSMRLKCFPYILINSSKKGNAIQIVTGLKVKNLNVEYVKSI
jgi:hypothetical protein